LTNLGTNRFQNGAVAGLDCFFERRRVGNAQHRDEVQTMRSILLSALLTVFGGPCLSGCGQADSVSGKVTYNGEPVEKGSVTFSSADGSGPGFGAQVVNGQYKAEKVRLGPHKAHVRGLTDAPPLTRDDFAKQQQQDNRYGLPVDYIPEDAEGNQQTVEITSGGNTVDFELKGPPRSG
jgi:hypothetical protein